MTAENTLWIWYHFRNPAQWRQPVDRLYREILDQIAWSENNGFDDAEAALETRVAAFEDCGTLTAASASAGR